MDFHFHETDEHVLVIEADGELNAQSAESFVADIEKLVSAGITRIIVDCTLVDYISSSGIAQLLRMHHRVRKRGGEVKLCAIKGLVGDILRFLRLDKIMHMYPDVAEASAAFQSAGEPG